jgi:hypothetical protein
MRSATEVRRADIVVWLLGPSASACVETDPAERIRRLGRHLNDCGRLEPAAWTAHATRTVVDGKRRLLQAADAVLSNGFPYPPFWRSALRRYQQAVLDSVQSPAVCVPVEFSDSSSVEESHARVQAYLRDFGTALEGWPAIWDLMRR